MKLNIEVNFLNPMFIVNSKYIFYNLINHSSAYVQCSFNSYKINEHQSSMASSSVKDQGKIIKIIRKDPKVSCTSFKFTFMRQVSLPVRNSSFSSTFSPHSVEHLIFGCIHMSLKPYVTTHASRLELQVVLNGLFAFRLSPNNK